MDNDWQLGDRVMHPLDGSNQHGWKGTLYDMYPELDGVYFGIKWDRGEVEELYVGTAKKLVKICKLCDHEVDAHQEFCIVMVSESSPCGCYGIEKENTNEN